MTDRSVEDLRNELRNLGYLSHGLERWFARDPWKSGTFWTELLRVSSKASLVIALFATAATSATMILRNGGLPLLETTGIAAIYLATSFFGAMFVHILVALALKWNPTFGIENPRALMIIAMALSGFLSLWIAAWWTAFPLPPDIWERFAFIGLLILFFSASSIVISAALLTFSIHETKTIPRIHRKSRTFPLLIGAILLCGLILSLSLTDPKARAEVEAPQVVVKPTDARIALIAVDGLTPELFALRSELSERFPHMETTGAPHAASAPEAWATIGTGTPPSLHGVRSVDGLRLFGGRRVIQNVSQLDYGLRVIAPISGLAERQPLPPSVRNRHYVWETLAKRGVPAIAVDWWTTEDEATGPLRTISQEKVFSRASSEGRSPAELGIEIDRLAIEELQAALDDFDARFVTVYLPALDVILNRLPVTDQTRLAATIRVLDQLTRLVESLSEGGWSMILVGIPGEENAQALVAATELDLAGAGLDDVAPTLLSLYGFPPSIEMPGESLVPSTPRITSYGSRGSVGTTNVSDDYYENLKSLGYIQ